MAEWIGSAVVGEIVNKASAYLAGQTELHAIVPEKLQRLRTSLRKIQAQVHEADRMPRIQDPGLAEWLKELKDAAYEADDVLDSFEYRRLQQQVEASMAQVSSFVSSPCNAAKRLRIATETFFYCDNKINMLNSTIERLARVAADIGDFRRLLHLDGAATQCEIRRERITSSLSATDRVFGRDEDRNDIVEFLLKFGGDPKNVSVLSIVGIGGIGKTAVAQLVYNDESVKEYFDKRIWVSVSDNFDVFNLTKEILECASHDSHEYSGLSNLNGLQKVLQQNLMSQRFLLVLDDVWDDMDEKNWGTPFAPLRSGKEGSKILITTRSHKVARTADTRKAINLEGLKGDDFWSFFKECSFGSENPDEHPKLAAMGKRIAGKLGGSPLAAKTVGRLMKAYLDDEHWINILGSEIWELQQGPNDIMPVLRLSFQKLPVHLQRCFAYFGVFPKGTIYRPDELIRMWIAQKFIYPENRKRLEDIGREYLDDLCSRSLIQAVENDDGDKEYILHNLVYNLAKSISMDECFIFNGVSRTIPGGVRHLWAYVNSLTDLYESRSELRNLRTLLFFGESLSNSDYVLLRRMLDELKSLRALMLHIPGMEKLPDNVGQLIHLRYLYLQDTSVQVLPDSFCRLYHLQYLAIKGSPLESLPTNTNNLTKLRHLDVCGERAGMIAGIGRLTSLQQLDSFPLNEENRHDICQLRNLNELRGSLSIKNLEHVQDKEKAREAALNHKTCLKELSLCWNSSISNICPLVSEEVLEGLKPHINLRRLNIIGYGGTRTPAWLAENQSLSNLEHLHLSDCRQLKQLPPLGHLFFLKDLRLTGLHAVTVLGCEFYGADDDNKFPFLEHLQFEDMPQWREWYQDEASRSFPRLRNLIIKSCPKLESLPPIPLSLEELHVENVGLKALPGLSTRRDDDTASSSSNNNGSTSLSSLSSVFIEGCPNLSSLSEGLFNQEHQRKLTVLQELIISNCATLDHLSTDGFRDLCHLTRLEISD